MTHPPTSGQVVAALYDVHGNLPALEAVLAEVRAARVDALVVGGDIAPGPMAREVLECLTSLELPVRFLHGNGDRAVVSALRGESLGNLPAVAVEAIQWSAGQLAEHLDVLASWPPTLRLSISGVGEVLFCHATPRNDTEIFTARTSEAVLQPVFAGLDVDLVVCGHTHIPFDRTVGAVRVVNAGSVGMPFGAAGADWLLLGPGIEHRHTSYDLAAAAARIRATAYPQADDFAERYVLHPPSAEAMLDVYARSELR
ncbi:MAG TPA: metallophosphoesterase family protein [Gemmatimonadaceae bacterium]